MRRYLQSSISNFRPPASIVLAVLGAAVVLGLGSRLSTVGSRLLFAYNAEQDDVNGQAVPARWQSGSVTWEINCTVGSNVQAGAGAGACTVEPPIQAAFNAWSTTPLTQGGPVLTGVQISEGPHTMLTNPDTSSGIDCHNIISFVPSTSVKFPTGAVAFTALATATASPGQMSFTYPCTSGGTTTNKTCTQPSCIIDADIIFNNGTCGTTPCTFSTATPTPSGDFDVQSVATHEIGHLLGLDHSGIAHSVMYPFGDVGVGQQRSLSTDDVIGLGFLYPSGSFASAVGTLAGNVTLSSTAVFGAHVVAIDVSTGNAAVDGLTDLQGKYSMDVPPGGYNVLALPLTGVYDLTNFGGWACGYAGTQENAPPCCEPGTPMCTGTPLSSPTNFTGTYLR